MDRIFKYNFGPLTPGVKTVTVSNELVSILDFQEQGDNLVMWATVRNNAAEKTVTIYVAWTGDVAPDWQYVKTIQSSNFLVYHIFLKPETT